MIKIEYETDKGYKVALFNNSWTVKEALDDLYDYADESFERTYIRIINITIVNGEDNE